MKFVRATSRNLPLVDFNMFLEFISTNDCLHGEERVTGKNKPFAVYGDNAVGWVQLKRDDDLCIVKAKICPQYPTNKRYYSVKITINEKLGYIDEAICSNCTGESDGCKHIAVFLKWLNKRSEDPRTSVVTIYCVKPRAGRIRKVNTAMQAEDDLCVDFRRSLNLSNTINNNCDLKKNVQKPVKQSKPKKTSATDRISTNDIRKYSMKALLNTYKGDTKNTIQFLKHVTDCLTFEICKFIEEQTRSQSDSSLWRILRQGRITASVIFEAVNCKKSPSSALKNIMGRKSSLTKAMARGKTLEDEVLKVAAKELGIKIHKPGLILRKEYPTFGASPDGIGENFVVEIKYPTTAASSLKYKKNGKIKNRFKHQMQLYMLMANKSYCYFVVADPNFEINNSISTIIEIYDAEFVKDMIDNALVYWNTFVFPKLLN